jgi:hypothetical protein
MAAYAGGVSTAYTPAGHSQVSRRVPAASRSQAAFPQQDADTAAMAELGCHRQRLCRIFNRPNSMVPEIRILGPPELARGGGS